MKANTVMEKFIIFITLYLEGYKHGIGRFYFPDGSYFYCWWEFDKKLGEVIYYNGKKHKWKSF